MFMFIYKFLMFIYKVGVVEFQLSDVYLVTRATRYKTNQVIPVEHLIRTAMAWIGALLFAILISTVGAVLHLYRK